MTYIDFTNLQKVCPKDNFLLPQIDQLLDATAGHELLSFMDAYYGYNRIPMFQLDEDQTILIGISIRSKEVWSNLPKSSEHDV